MSNPKIGIVISTTREGRLGFRVADWVHRIAARRSDLEFEIIDLRDYTMPFFDEPMSPAYAPPAHEAAQKWAAKVASLDGFIFITAEYNHGMPAVLKNALDYAYTQFNRKPAAFVGYGGVGGARAVEQLRLVLIELQMAPLRAAVHIGGGDFVGLLMHGKDFSDSPHLEPMVGPMLDDLSWWTRTLKAAR